MVEHDAVIVGAGPNGLAAAITLAEKGLKPAILEGNNKIGGGARSSELTLAGFIHDTGSAIHPFGAASPFYSSLPLSQFGLEWINSPAALAHPFDDGSAVILGPSIAATAETLGVDAKKYTNLIRPCVGQWDKLIIDLLGTRRFPQHFLTLARFGLKGFCSAKIFTDRYFTGFRAKGFFAGLAAHSALPLNQIPSAAFGLTLCIAGHTIGWPVPKAGTGSLTTALSKYLYKLGGSIVTGHYVKSAADLPSSKSYFFDTSPATLVKIYDDLLPAGYKKKLQNYQYGPGVFKIDWALSAPIPWKAKECTQALTVHLGGTFDEIAKSELAAWHGRIIEKPFVILAQPSLFDSSRMPRNKHIAWAYCHVPNNSPSDMTEYIEAQIERFASGFRELILARHVSTPAKLEAENPNLVGGDIVGGAQTLKQILCRPTCNLVPYSTPLKGVYICSSSTPPGAGVHGMCGYHAASAYLSSLM
ncbi:MAG TPA: NAD(P)/FAD-dependent oxidoreductase [Dehalococcoidia bacterium]